MPIVRKRIYLGTYVVIDFDHKVTNSSPLTRKMTSKRLYFNYFKDRLVHFNGTAMISYMKKLLIIFCFTFGIVFGLYKIGTSQPRYLAASFERVPEFFSLPSEFNYSNSTVCLDEMHSQGRKFEDFGSAFYELTISEKNSHLR